MESNGHKEEKPAEREKWGKQIEFFLSLLGYSVGIGNVVRFPYLCFKNGGGAFVIPFFLAHVFCGFPLFIMELLLGQFSGLSPFTLWNFCPLFKGIGYSMAAISGVMSIYYNTLMAYCVFFFIQCFTFEVPWQSCDNPWNTEACWDGNTRLDNLNSTNMTTVGNATANLTRIWASDEFWHRRVLEMSSGVEEMGGLRWELFFCLVFSWVLVFLALGWGIKWTGKVVYVTVLLPYVLLLALIVRGCTLDGAEIGLKYYLVPNFEKLEEPKTWIEASIQMFYSLGPAWGGLITMSSYNRFRHNCYREGIGAPFCDMGTALVGGIAMFSIMGFMASQTGVDMNNLTTGSGPGLAFIVYPLAMSKLPVAPLWTGIFFLTLITLGVDSMFGTFETVISGIFDAWPNLRKHNLKVVSICCAVAFVFGLPFCTRGGMYYFQIVDWYAAIITVPVIALCEVIAVCYIYGIGRFSRDVEIMMGKRPNIVFLILLCFAAPIVLLIILVVIVAMFEPPKYYNYTYPGYVHYLGLLLSLSTTLPLPITAIWVLAKIKPAPDCGFWQGLLYRLKVATSPNEHWYPADPVAKEQYLTERKKRHRIEEHEDGIQMTTPLRFTSEDKPQSTENYAANSSNHYHQT